ncbi:MAG: hypothetical protein MJZ07_07095 [Bacteroidales bacterium]|nr:hypothetical protein [Bacteroidales bacterium]
MIKVLLNATSENYDSPKCSVVEISTQSVLCGSRGYKDSVDVDDDEDLGEI